jgi:hypothetical protein
VVAVVVMAKARDWPAELRKPITMKQLRNAGSGLSKIPRANEFTVDEIKQRYIAECVRRVAVMRNFFKVSNSELGNVLLVSRLCRHWGIPGFDIVEEPKRGAGAPTIWTPQKRCEVFADVMSLVKPPHISENRACQILAERRNARYKGMSDKTIHREFLRARKTIIGDPWFRATYFRQNAFRGLLFEEIPTFGPGLIEMAIRKYSIAQELKQYNSA